MELVDRESMIWCLECLVRLLDGSKIFFLINEYGIFPALWKLFKTFDDRDLVRLLLKFYSLLFDSKEFELGEMVFTEDFQKMLEDKFDLEAEYK